MRTPSGSAKTTTLSLYSLPVHPEQVISTSRLVVALLLEDADRALGQLGLAPRHDTGGPVDHHALGGDHPDDVAAVQLARGCPSRRRPCAPCGRSGRSGRWPCRGARCASTSRRHAGPARRVEHRLLVVTSMGWTGAPDLQRRAPPARTRLGRATTSGCGSRPADRSPPSGTQVADGHHRTGERPAGRAEAVGAAVVTARSWHASRRTTRSATEAAEGHRCRHRWRASTASAREDDVPCAACPGVADLAGMVAVARRRPRWAARAPSPGGAGGRRRCTCAPAGPQTTLPICSAGQGGAELGLGPTRHELEVDGVASGWSPAVGSGLLLQGDVEDVSFGSGADGFHLGYRRRCRRPAPGSGSRVVCQRGAAAIEQELLEVGSAGPLTVVSTLLRLVTRRCVLRRVSWGGRAARRSRHHRHPGPLPCRRRSGPNPGPARATR